MLVQPKSAEWYRSQVTRTTWIWLPTTAANCRVDMHLSPKGNPQQTFTSRGKTYKLWTLTKTGPGGFSAEVTQTNLAGDPVDQNGLLKTRDFHPIINYQATYPPGSTYSNGNPIPDGTPVLAMLDRDNNIVYSDLTAVITGPDAGLLPANSGDPVFLP